MFKTPQPLDRVQHAALRYAPAPDAGFAAHLTWAPLVAEELNEAAAHYPVLFSPKGNVVPVAVLGLGERNVFLDQDLKWRVPYIPAHVRRYPFALARLPNHEGQLALAIDADAPHFATGEGEPLVDDAGGLTDKAQKASEFLKALEVGLQRTQQVLGVLDERGVLVLKDVQAVQGGSKRVVATYRMVDIDRVKALDDATLADWARNGVLAAVHAHLASVRHLKGVMNASMAH